MEEIRLEERQQVPRGHKVNVTGRKTANITGVNDVLSFDAQEVLLSTEQGILMLRGEELHINRLTLEKGEVDVDGKINSLTYSEQKQTGKTGESIFHKLFQ